VVWPIPHDGALPPTLQVMEDMVSYFVPTRDLRRYLKVSTPSYICL
jgi:hypothetical protein